MAGQGQGNPAVVGLAGFGLTLMLLQFHSLGWCGTGVVFCTAIVLGGGAQMIAGFQEFKCGNNFSYSAFTVFGTLWLALGLVWLIQDLQGAQNSFIGKNLRIEHHDIGILLLVYTFYAMIMLVASLRISGMMAIAFATAVLGLIGLDLIFLAGMKQLVSIVAWDLIVCSLAVWYMMAHIIFLQVYGRDILPVGKPWITLDPVEKSCGKEVLNPSEV
jgi:succinate-acetate transporter protein